MMPPPLSIARSFESWYPTSPETCLLLADTIVVCHFAVVLFLIIGALLILLGRFRGWHWIGNRWFRGSHLSITGFVAAVAAAGDLCPLTIWENDLRQIAGQQIEKSSFLGYWAHELLFVDVNVEILGVIYIVFALLVISSVFFAPVRWKGRRKPPSQQPAEAG